MADHNNNNDVISCYATTTLAASRDNNNNHLRVMKSRVDATAVHDETQRRHNDVTLTSLIDDDDDDASWSTDSRSAVIGYSNKTTGGRASSASVLTRGCAVDRVHN